MSYYINIKAKPFPMVSLATQSTNARKSPSRLRPYAPSLKTIFFESQYVTRVRGSLPGYFWKSPGKTGVRNLVITLERSNGFEKLARPCLSPVHGINNEMEDYVGLSRA